ncbi:cytochrome c [Vibrio sp. RE88]|uniref:c-type cytochrome n=1 Tax=Vibrio sp. RE88 TaxID=2607610 RepID=UPI001493A6BB|nr:cytochrome c [Vibrio sp. RE88]
MRFNQLQLVITGLLLVSMMSFAASEQVLTQQEVESISITVFPDGQGLPKGAGNAIQGEALYKVQCLACHGANGEGGLGPKLVGRENQAPFWSTGSSWPYATSLFDYIRRAMPPMNVKSLKPDEVYALTAYLLYKNDIIDQQLELTEKNLADVEMPAKEYSRSKWLEEEKALFQQYQTK